MTYVFFGAPDFAKIVLEKLIASGFIPAVVVCNPDRPAGRKKELTSPPVKQLVTNMRLRARIFQPEDPAECEGELRELAPDLAIVAAYSRILPAKLLSIPRLGTIGVHPSLLPELRGTTPIQSAILAGKAETGTTLYLMDAQVDHGPLLASRTLPLNTGDTYATAHDALAKLSGELLTETIPPFLNSRIAPKAQNHAAATFTKKFTGEDAFVPPETLERARSGERGDAETVYNTIRALNPEPGAWTLEDGKRVKLIAAKLEGGRLKLTVIQREGKTPVHVS